MATTVVQENEGSREPDVGAVLSRTIREALSRYPPISDVVIASNEGLVIAYQSKRAQRGLALSALAPLINDAGQTVFRELALNGLGEVFLVGEQGTVYLVRCSLGKCFVMVAAHGSDQLGILRLVASEIEKNASASLRRFVR